MRATETGEERLRDDILSRRVLPGTPLRAAFGVGDDAQKETIR
jgi:hypothetical protein